MFNNIISVIFDANKIVLKGMYMNNQKALFAKDFSRSSIVMMETR